MKRTADFSLLPHNTFKMDVLAEEFVEYSSVEELLDILKECREKNRKWMPIGGGSNLLFCQDFEGVILHSCIKGMEIVEENDSEVLLRVGAGEKWDDFVEYTTEHNWCGCENLSFIPGEVGASAVQNIGAYGAEVKDTIEWVEVVDATSGAPRKIPNIECDYDYRYSRFKDDWRGKYVVTYVSFRLKKEKVLNIGYGELRKRLPLSEELATPKDVRETIIKIRMEKLPDPKVWGNAGSFFKNPYIGGVQLEELKEKFPDIPYYKVNDDLYKLSAAWLIDRCGMKGFSIGKAQVCETQPLVIINLGGAKAKEVIAVADSVYGAVADLFGVALSEEVQYV